MNNLDSRESFIVSDPSGNKVNCRVLFALMNDKNGKEYIVYTDRSRDANEEENIFASIKTPCENGKYRLDSIECDEEWYIIEMAVEQYKRTNAP